MRDKQPKTPKPRKALKRGSKPMARGRIRQGGGKKTDAWAQTRAALKTRFEAAGITRCERCGTDNALSFAHRFKRRKITSQGELETVALLCMPPSESDCHGFYERMSAEDMYVGITKIIMNRERQP